MVTVSGTECTHTYMHTHIHSNMDTHFLGQADMGKLLSLMMLQTLRKYRWFIVFKFLFVFSHLMIQLCTHLQACMHTLMCVRVHVYV